MQRSKVHGEDIRSGRQRDRSQKDEKLLLDRISNQEVMAGSGMVDTLKQCVTVRGLEGKALRR